MPDQLEDLFAELRAGTLPRVQPPGTGAARETVRRRRATKRVAVVAALLTVAGGTTAIGVTTRGADQAQPSGNDRSALNAVEQLGDRRTGGLVGAEVPAAFRDVPAGSYTLAVACSGSGVLTMQATIKPEGGKPGDLGGQVVSCATDPHPATMLVRVPEDGVVTVSVEGDSQADDGSSYAVALGVNEDVSESDQPSEESLWNAQRAADVLSVSTSLTPRLITTEVGSQTLVTSADAGEYMLRLACAGPGFVNFKMEELISQDGKSDAIGATLADEAVDCLNEEPETYKTFVTVFLPAHAGYVVTVNPDEGARNKAGLAYVLAPQ